MSYYSFLVILQSKSQAMHMLAAVSELRWLSG